MNKETKKMDCKTVNLKKGSKGDTVKELQTILKEKGYYKGKIDGDFGSMTETAVKQLQKAQGNDSDGVFGPKTCQKLQTNKSSETTKKSGTLKQGSKGTLVNLLQTKLKDLGYYNAEIDGEYGTKTVNAVKTFQHYYNLVSDGIYGEKTQNVLTNTKILKETNNSKRISKALGLTIKDPGTLYMAVLKNGLYVLYYNDIYTYKQEIERVEQKKRLNCTDWAQLGMQLLLEMGYPKEKIRIVRGVVVCSDDKSYGHVWLQLYLNGQWINYDLSAAAAHGHGLGKVICNRSFKITNIDPAWAVSDDGKT